ncbi:MAG: peptide deformylase [Bacteroidetes bacterium]|nr:peptide deformylase [Bacteroidota bacterium]
MAVQTILQMGDPRLRTTCGRVTSFKDESIRSCIDDLRDTLTDSRRQHGFGRAIAAPQIGSKLQVVYIHAGKPLVLINPRIVKRGRKKMTLWDECFSFPDILVKVRRHLAIDVRYQDEKGNERSLRADGSLSELLQHEIDHLAGVLAIDRAIDSRHIVFRKEYERWIRRHDVAM